MGCEGPPSHPRSDLDQQLFGAAAVRIHPTFTQLRNLSGGTKPDGIEATLEIDDQFGEPTRSTGCVRFELFHYRKTSPQVRGDRIGGPWKFCLNTVGEQQEHWNSALRAYTFQISFPQISASRYYVLTAQFDLNGEAATKPAAPTSGPSTRAAGRLFDQLILAPQAEEKDRGHYHAPIHTPGH